MSKRFGLTCVLGVSHHAAASARGCRHGGTAARAHLPGRSPAPSRAASHLDTENVVQPGLTMLPLSTVSLLLGAPPVMPTMEYSAAC